MNAENRHEEGAVLAILVLLVMLLAWACAGCSLFDPRTQAGLVNKQQDVSTTADAGGVAVTGGQGDSIALWVSVILGGVVSLGLIAIIGGLGYQLILRPLRIGREVARNGKT